MTGEVTIRKAEVDDIDNISLLLLELWGQSGVYPSGELQKIIKHGMSYVLLSSTLEFIGVCFMKRIGKEDIRVFILALNEKYRGRGLGKKLMKTSIQECISSGMRNFSLHTEIDNEIAINLYKSLGFEINSIKENYYSGSIDAVYMVKTVNEFE